MENDPFTTRVIRILYMGVSRILILWVLSVIKISIYVSPNFNIRENKAWAGTGRILWTHHGKRHK